VGSRVGAGVGFEPGSMASAHQIGLGDFYGGRAARGSAEKKTGQSWRTAVTDCLCDEIGLAGLGVCSKRERHTR